MSDQSYVALYLYAETPLNEAYINDLLACSGVVQYQVGDAGRSGRIRTDSCWIVEQSFDNAHDCDAMLLRLTPITERLMTHRASLSPDLLVKVVCCMPTEGASSSVRVSPSSIQNLAMIKANLAIWLSMDDLNRPENDPLFANPNNVGNYERIQSMLLIQDAQLSLAEINQHLNLKPDVGWSNGADHDEAWDDYLCPSLESITHQAVSLWAIRHSARHFGFCPNIVQLCLNRVQPVEQAIQTLPKSAQITLALLIDESSPPQTPCFELSDAEIQTLARIGAGFFGSFVVHDLDAHHRRQLATLWSVDQ